MKAPYRYAPQGSKFVQLERGTLTGKTYSSHAAARQDTLRMNDAWRAKRSMKRNPLGAEAPEVYDARNSPRARETELLALIEPMQKEYQVALLKERKARARLSALYAELREVQKAIDAAGKRPFSGPF